jgi:hypothetical protein
MSQGITLFHLQSATMHPCFATKQSHAEALQGWLCSGCLDPKPGVHAVDVCLQDRVPRDKPMNLVHGWGVGLIHRELLDLLGDDIVEQDLYIGRIVGARGNVVTDWVTFRGRRGVIVRGSSDDAACRVCDQCGRNIYYAGGKRYLYPAPPCDATIFESHLSGLVVPPKVYERVATKKWRRLGIDKLPVLDQPTDGLGVIPFK